MIIPTTICESYHNHNIFKKERERERCKNAPYHEALSNTHEKSSMQWSYFKPFKKL